MSITGFNEKDFDTFHIDGLEERMKAIQARIQPKFKEIGTELTEHLSVATGNEMFLHIAKHARRSVNPPNDTWLAIADNKRGYKKHPHFQLGLFDDHLFIWLALIYELPGKSKIATSYLSNMEMIKALPESFVFSMDHMKKDAATIQSLSEKDLQRIRDVKKAELLIGRHLTKKEAVALDGKTLTNQVKETINALLPLYKKALEAL